MSENNRVEQLDDCLAHVNAERRDFLKRLLVGSAAAAMLPLMASSAIAGELDDDPVNAKGDGSGKGKKKGRGKGKKKGSG